MEGKGGGEGETERRRDGEKERWGEMERDVEDSGKLGGASWR
jgi:hypothetical protein